MSAVPGIPDEDLKVEALRRPPGGQHVGTETGVRVTHLPSGLMAECKSERSQHRNRQIALDMILGGLTSTHMKWVFTEAKPSPEPDQNPSQSHEPRRD